MFYTLFCTFFLSHLFFVCKLNFQNSIYKPCFSKFCFTLVPQILAISGWIFFLFIWLNRPFLVKIESYKKIIPLGLNIFTKNKFWENFDVKFANVLQIGMCKSICGSSHFWRIMWLCDKPLLVTEFKSYWSRENSWSIGLKLLNLNPNSLLLHTDSLWV
jgi:hypothetical protein